MRNEFIMSTANTIEGCPIKKYIDTICSNIVIGTNVLSDFAASFIDFFGGRSDSYKRKLEIIYGRASKALKQEALNLDANAIISFRVDFDEISDKDKSMFMVSVSGTACIIEMNDKELSEEEIIRIPISQSDLQKEIDRRYIVSQMKDVVPLTSEWVEFLLECPQTEVIESLIKRYIPVDLGYYAEEATNIKRVLSATPPDFVVPVVYQHIEHKKIRILIKEYRLFDDESIHETVVKGKTHEGVRLLPATKSSYDARDLRWMKTILECLNNLPDAGKIEVVGGSVFTRDNGGKYICEDGRKDPVDSSFCEKYGANMRGITKGEVKHIGPLKERYNIIEQYTQ